MNFLCNTATFKSYFVVVFIFLWYPSHKFLNTFCLRNRVTKYPFICFDASLRLQLSGNTSYLNVHFIKLIYFRKISCHNTGLSFPWCLTYIPSVSSINIYFLKLLPVEKPTPAPRPTGSVWKESQGQRHLPGRQADCSGEDKAWCVQQRASREAQRQSRPKSRRLQHSPKHRRVSGPEQGSREP